MEEKPKTQLAENSPSNQDSEETSLRDSIFKNPPREEREVIVTPEQALEFQNAYYKQIVDALSEEVQHLLKLLKVTVAQLPEKKQNEVILRLREIMHVASIKMNFFTEHEPPKDSKKLRKLN
jgi:hypothetical protein